jgi:hypothetical protein
MMQTTNTIRTLTVAIFAAFIGPSTGAMAQVGQTAMSPSTGLANRAVAGIQSLDANGPGWLYYGLNAADRGLGYNGSYMTLGGFIPFAEDDLGGNWSADLRSHLSEYGGFFSNTGLVRKQFLGGTLLGLGIYWDYDGDLNQYPTSGAVGTSQYGQFGHVYNQVGVSGEWLTDFGNLRSNGYIPVGTTAYTVGAPGNPFVGNYLMCQYGLDTALSGADLEIGAYVPGLSDWAGMVSVGGYALGNARYDWGSGTKVGQNVVPYFGGVYTRLDLTLVKNWDFSLQANNDSYFDWTGFARLTYRMGGSRRRNVPDQMEQPMMRNEHIVRAHQTPVVAINPATGNPWRVIHVNNTGRKYGATGTAETPFTTLTAAQTWATQQYDIMFVHGGASATTPYASNWQFQADNQILVGEGSTLQLNTATCGYKQFFNTLPATSFPVLTSTGNAITLRNGVVVDHFQVASAAAGVGILGPVTLTGTANVNDVAVAGGAKSIDLSAVQANATVNLFNMSATGAATTPLDVGASTAAIKFQGTLQGTTTPNPLPATTQGNRTADTLDTGLVRNPAITAPFSPVPVP